MDRLKFTEILLNAYTTGGTFYAATKLTLAAERSVGDGVMTVTAAGIANSPVSCYDPVAKRTAVGVTNHGYTVWGLAAPMGSTCGKETGGVDLDLGLSVPTQNATNTPGWDDYNNGCGCANTFTPGDIGMRRGYFGLR